ncbi:MAG: DNA-directed RNA polymerase subunit alpha [Minisyncoccia bacterium]
MFQLFSNFKIQEQNKFFGRFEIEGLYPGYGITLGNALRRVLLSSIEGAAVTSFKIEGVPHEFSTIEGVKETVIDIMLNLKKLRVKLFDNQPQILKMSVKGEKEVFARDFEPNPLVEILNPDLKIATLTDKKAKIEMEATVEKGLGYSEVEERKKEKLSIGTIAIDAIFSPVMRVNFWVENMRVGERTDYNRLFIEIETDGSVTPQEALIKAANILDEHFSLLKEKASFSLPTGKEEEVLKREKIKREPKDISIEELNLSNRTKNALLNNGIKTLAGLLRYRQETLAQLEGLGDKAIEEIKKVLKDLTYTLKD